MGGTYRFVTLCSPFPLPVILWCRDKSGIAFVAVWDAMGVGGAFGWYSLLDAVHYGVSSLLYGARKEEKGVGGRTGDSKAFAAWRLPCSRSIVC
jgi:hypothetical protein